MHFKEYRIYSHKPKKNGMKKTTFAILATILVFTSIDTTAQIKKGEKMIGASLSFTSRKIALMARMMIVN